MLILPVVLFAFLLLFFRSLRQRFFYLYLLLFLGVCWWYFPIKGYPFKYPIWHAYYLHFWLKWHMAAINFVLFVAYGWDKRAAIKHKWRVPENTLHLMALMGGSPAAFVASRLFRHKTSKVAFKKRFWIIVAAQAVLLVYLFLPRYFNGYVVPAYEQAKTLAVEKAKDVPLPKAIRGK